MTVKVKRFYGNSIPDAAKLCLKHRLYVSQWLLREELLRAVTEPSRYELAVTFKNDKPVALALLLKRQEYKNSISAFCKKSERKNGYASMAVKKLPLNNVIVGDGIHGSIMFWKKAIK